MNGIIIDRSVEQIKKRKRKKKKKMMMIEEGTSRDVYVCGFVMSYSKLTFFGGILFAV